MGILDLATRAQVDNAVCDHFMDMAYATFQDMDESTIATEYLKTLLAYAESTHQLFHSGAFVIMDPEGKIWDFFDNRPESYSRVSSHDMPGNPPQFGLDLPEVTKINFAGIERDIIHILFAKFTIHQGQTQHQCLFLKPEIFGTQGCCNKIRHWCEWLRTRPCWRSEPEGYVFRKDRVDSKYTAKFKELAGGGGCGIGQKPFVYEMLAALDPHSKMDLQQLIAQDIHRSMEDCKEELGFACRLGREVFVPLKVSNEAMDKAKKQLAPGAPSESSAKRSAVSSL